MSKSESLVELRGRLARMFDARFQGTDAVRFARAQGFADGYMQALIDLGIATDRELLAVVNEERRAAAARAGAGLVSSIPPGPAVPSYA